MMMMTMTGLQIMMMTRMTATITAITLATIGVEVAVVPATAATGSLPMMHLA
jgi:hypothetical protein